MLINGGVASYDILFTFMGLEVFPALSFADKKANEYVVPSTHFIPNIALSPAILSLSVNVILCGEFLSAFPDIRVKIIFPLIRFSERL